MTTSVGNKSETIRYSGVSSRNKNSLDPTSLIGTDNYVWYFQLKTRNYLEHPILVALVALTGQQVPPEALAAHAAWVKGQKKVVLLMLLTMDLEIQRNLAHLGASGTKSFVFQTSLTADRERISRMQAGGRVQKNQKNKPHKAAKGGHGKGKGKMGYASNNAPFAPKPKTPPPPKKDNPAKDAICHQCGEVGHWRRNCPVYLAELMKKKKLSQGASTLYFHHRTLFFP
nr:zinc finger, CCHC-type [Tanacetum cinerariifolium]